MSLNAMGLSLSGYNLASRRQARLDPSQWIGFADSGLQPRAHDRLQHFSLFRARNSSPNSFLAAQILGEPAAPPFDLGQPLAFELPFSALRQVNMDAARAT